jgi:hypothetical protein
MEPSMLFRAITSLVAIMEDSLDQGRRFDELAAVTFGCDRFDMDDFTQPDETCWDSSKPLGSSYGDIWCPVPVPMPDRLERLVPYSTFY